MPQPKDKDWPNAYKNKTPIYAAYKKSTSNLETYTTENKGLEKILHSNGDQKRVGELLLSSVKSLSHV